MTTLHDVTRRALEVPGIASAAIFVTRSGSSELALGAAAGIDGPALDGLVAAVRNPAHPVARALIDPGPTFDVRPMNPGGPALRSHLPLDGRGVLALAHESSLSDETRAMLERLAAEAAAALLEGWSPGACLIATSASPPRRVASSDAATPARSRRRGARRR